MNKLKLTLFLLILTCIAVSGWSVWAGEYIDPAVPGYPTNSRGMHACDDGHVMSGIHVAQNLFLCASPILDGNPDDAKRRIVDNSTRQLLSGELIRTCPPGMVMKGFHEANDLLLCEPASIDEATTRTDFNTTRLNMHACPPGQVMKGIKVDRNILVCTNLASF
ncbi:MAG TPA: hypothetical protein VLB46_14725 [Pyrinomonadaceae bacterium]|nr:hypothetical protein [Pyrinomonadaceae bacterium]